MRQGHIFGQRRPTLIVFRINLHERYRINSTTRQKYSNYTSVDYSKQYLPRTPDSAERPSNISRPWHILQQFQHSILQIILRNLGSGITGRIRLSRILKAQIDPTLQRLDPAHRPMRNHRSTANLVVCLQPLNLPEKKVNLVPPAPLGIPIQLLHGGPGVRRGREKERFLI